MIFFDVFAWFVLLLLASMAVGINDRLSAPIQSPHQQNGSCRNACAVDNDSVRRSAISERNRHVSCDKYTRAFISESVERYILDDTD